MPLLYTLQLNDSTSVALWENTEVETFFFQNLQLSANDLQVITSLKLPQRRLERLGCRMALSHLLQKQNINIEYTPNGQPYINEGCISFAHTDKISAAAISNHKIGIDIEFTKERICKLYHKFISEKELENCNTQNIKDLYYYWCAKEAAYKWYGKGNIDFLDDVFIDKEKNKVTIKQEFEQKIHYIEVEELVMVVIN